MGIVATLAWHAPLCKHWLWLVAALLLVIFSLLHPKLFLLGFSFLGGLILANYRAAPLITDQTQLTQLVSQPVIFSGQIQEDPVTERGQTTVRLRQLDLLATPGTPPVASFSGTLYVQLSGNHSELERSDIITISGQLGSGFGTFSGSLYRAELLNIERVSLGDIFARIKHWFAERVRSFLPAPESDLGLGYLMGMKAGLPENLSAALQAIGMTHVIVASGAHLGILVSAAKKLFGRLSKFAGLFGSVILICVFVLIVGFTPSMMRAGLVSLLSILVGYVGRRFTPGRLLSFVAATTLLVEPFYLFNLGWQLSFASFFGLLIFAPHLQSFLYGGKQPPWLASMLLTSIATSVLCAPILIYNFGSLSLLSLIVNLIILPTLPYAMLLIFLTGASSCLPFLAQLVARLTTLLLDFHIAVVSFFSTQKTFILEFENVDWRIFLLYLPILGCLTLPYIAKRYKLLYNQRHAR